MTSPIRSLALASALLAVLAACSKPEQPQMPPPEVVVMTATPKDVPLQRDLVGRLSPYRSSDVRARVAGVVQKRVYQEGSDVKEGQVLFLIDPAPLQASLSAAQANLASAQATYANAKVAADRARQLAPQKFVSKSDLDNAEAAERSAAAAVQQARANVETARINLGYASVTAPIAGRAGKQQVTEGALVGQGETTPLATIQQLDPIHADVTQSLGELTALRQALRAGELRQTGEAAATATLVQPDGSVYPHSGTLLFTDLRVDPSTQQVTLRSAFPNPDLDLLPGGYVRVRLAQAVQPEGLSVAQRAILRDSAGVPKVLVVDADDKVSERTLVLGSVQGDRWVVLDGLAAGERVVVEGLQHVKPGDPVRIAPEPTSSASAASAP